MDKPVRRFRSASSTQRLAPDVQQRHGRIATQAFITLGGAEPAAAFLNTHHEELGGRPLDVAGASAEGLVAVETALRARTASGRA